MKLGPAASPSNEGRHSPLHPAEGHRGRSTVTRSSSRAGESLRELVLLVAGETPSHLPFCLQSPKLLESQAGTRVSNRNPGRVLSHVCLVSPGKRHGKPWPWLCLPTPRLPVLWPWASVSRGGGELHLWRARAGDSWPISHRPGSAAEAEQWLPLGPDSESSGKGVPWCRHVPTAEGVPCGLCRQRPGSVLLPTFCSGPWACCDRCRPQLPSFMHGDRNGGHLTGSWSQGHHSTPDTWWPCSGRTWVWTAHTARWSWSKRDMWLSTRCQEGLGGPSILEGAVLPDPSRLLSLWKPLPWLPARGLAPPGLSLVPTAGRPCPPPRLLSASSLPSSAFLAVTSTLTGAAYRRRCGSAPVSGVSPAWLVPLLWPTVMWYIAVEGQRESCVAHEGREAERALRTTSKPWTPKPRPQGPTASSHTPPAYRSHPGGHRVD